VGVELVSRGELGRLSLVVLLFVVVQETVMLDIRIGGVHPDIMVLLPIVAGLVGGPSRGATIGFSTGLVSDLFLPTPFGLSALVGCLLGFGTGLATQALDRTAGWLAPVAALGGSALYELTYGSLGSVLGQPQMLHVALARIVVVVSVTNAVLAIPAVRLMSWGLDRASTEGMPMSDAGVGAAR
jgi:rod shape-determining protein MreD